MGFSETISLSLAPAAPGARVPLQNPLAGGQGALRDGLVFPGLLDALALNLRQGRRDVALFEIGKVFAADGAGVRETPHLGLLWCGATEPPHWSRKARPADFFDGKGARGARLVRRSGPATWRSPRRAVRTCTPDGAWTSTPTAWSSGWLGVLHPDRAEALGVRTEVVIAEIGLGMVGALPGPGRAHARAGPVPRGRPRPVGHHGPGGARGRAARRGAGGGGAAAAGRGGLGPVRGRAAAGRAGEPDVVLAVPGAGAHAPGRRGGPRDAGRRGAPARGRTRDQGRVNVAQDDGFELLEEKVKRAAELVKALRQENKDLEQQRRQAETRLKDAEKGLATLEKQKGAAAADHKRVEQLDEEVATLRHEREEVRRRIAKLVAVLDEVE